MSRNYANLHNFMGMLSYCSTKKYFKLLALRKVICMAVRIRLARIGKKKAPFYKLVAIDGRAKRDGQYLENLGTYNPLTGDIIQYHAEKVQAWIDKGAIPSETAVRIGKLYKKSLKTEATVTVEKKAPAKKAKKAEAAA